MRGREWKGRKLSGVERVSAGQCSAASIIEREPECVCVR
jgi:hypothetical protein